MALSIPEIVQAYQNDPRTMLAQNAMKAGSSTAPVAGGKFAFADALARALQGVAGGVIERGNQKHYEKEEDDYHTALAKALQAGRGPMSGSPAEVMSASGGGAPAAGGMQPGLEGTAGAGVGGPSGAAGPVNPPPPGMVPPAPQNNAPPPPAGPPMPAPPPQPQAGPPAPGPGGPPAPPPMPAMPQAPQIDAGPVRSRHTAIADALMGSGNKYLTRMATEQALQGVDDEQRQSEAAAGRKFDLAKTTYGAQLDDYMGARSDGRRASYAAIQSDTDFQHQLKADEKQHGYRMSEQGAQAAAEMARAKLSASTSFAIASMNEAGANKRANLSANTQLQVAGINKGGPAGGGARMTGPMIAALGKSNDVIRGNEALKTDIQRFMAINKRTATGGLASLTTFVPGLRAASNPDYAQLVQISKAMIPKLRQGMPGAVSDTDAANFEKSAPNPKMPYQANVKGGMATVAVIDRQNAYQRMNQTALATGNPQQAVEMGKAWSQYVNTVPLFNEQGDVRQKVPTFEQWQARTRYDAKGNPIK